MSTSQNVETCKKAISALHAGDLETALSLYDDDVELVLPGNSTVSGTFRRAAGVAEAWAMLAEKSAMMTPSLFLADGDNVVVIGQFTAGGESATEAILVTFRDGKIVKLQSFKDTALLERVFGTSRGARRLGVFSALESSVPTSATVPFSHPRGCSTPGGHAPPAAHRARRG